MHIKQVVIRGFKTYKDQTTLDEDFSPGTNVVVGFNGSGKSNFFQAILFVLSDQYSSLRAETRKALLHEGAGQAVLTAYVEVILDNSDRRIPVDNDQVSIRRLIGVKKDDWILDGRHATKAEVFGLLEGAGFAKTSPYYIVQQGKVSELTLMTDAQRLGLLKDISGAGVYDERRAEAVKIMHDTGSRRARCDELISEIESKLTALEGEQRELRECERLESQRRTLEYVLADREWRTAQERIEELDSRRTESSGKLLEFQGELQTLRKRIVSVEVEKERREESRRRAEESHATFEAERDKKFEALAKVRLEADEGTRRQREAEERGSARLASIEHARAELMTATEELVVIRQKTEEAEAQSRDLEQRHLVVSAQMEQLNAKQGRRQQYKNIEERNAALDEEIRRRTIKMKEGRRALEECDAKMAKSEERKARASSGVVTQREELCSVERRLAELGQTMRSLGERLESGSEKVRLLHQDRSRASRDLEQTRRDAVASQHRLEGTLPRSHRQGLSAVMRWAEEQGLQDRIRGPLLSHMEVPAAFRCAVESFAGMGVFNILAMDDEVAAQAVKIVRTKRLGAVVVTPLSQIRVQEQQYPKLEGVKALVDVIRCPDWARPALCQVFGKAVACRTMELCEQVARTHGFDTITLEGDRVSRRGVVTGGYQDPGRNIRLSLAETIRISHQKVQEAEASLPDLDSKISAASEVQDALHAERRSVQEERDQVRAKLQGLTEQVQGLEAKVSHCTRDVADLKEWRHRMEGLVRECEASVEAKKTERATSSLGATAADSEALGRLTAEIEELEAAKDSARSQRRVLQASLEEREAKIESCLRKRLHDLETEAVRDSGDDTLESAEVAAQSRTRLEREHREASDGADAAAAEMCTLAEESAEAKRTLEELVAEEQRLQDQVSQASVRVDQLTAEAAGQTQKKADVDARLRTLIAPVADIEQCRQIPKAQLVRNLADANRELQTYQHVNRKAVEQYENFSEQLTNLRRRKDEIDLGEASISEALAKIDEQKEATMLHTLRRVNEFFKQVFSEMVPGGMGKLQVIRRSEGVGDDAEDDERRHSHAETEATEESASANPSGELVGVKIEVSFTGQAQSFLAMSQLSGGQKTVVALTLIFSIQRLEPAPFYLLDEVDAALDSSYRSALANLVAKTAKSSQVVYTTFRPEVLDKADRCYRVYQQNRASRIDAVTQEQAKQVLREQDRLAQVAHAAG
eukprot:TRINITY_DN11627_c1_g3_i1.p1 TRINITY_DN11627_c1_g3~~TRINITY_DN11627_c1_g3_i1.p1  ORF type:complete len:1218 (-),score=270.49 TRINITY_DN11627_c1_g3_i1:296-3949(-)